MFNDPNITHQIFSSRVKKPATEYVGDQGRLFYHEDTGELRISDGVTPHGRPIFIPTSGGGSVALKLYAENGNPTVLPVSGAQDAIALGNGAYAHAPGSVVQSAGVFTASGDAQIGSYVARNITTTQSFTELFLNSSMARLLIPANSTTSFSISIIGRRTDSGSEGAVYDLRGGVDRGPFVSSVALIGKLNKTIVTEDTPLWDVTADVDVSTGALRIWVKGETGKTIRWVAHIQTVEVKN